MLSEILSCACLAFTGAPEALPDPNARLPTGPVTLAARMRATDDALGAAVGRWVREGDPSRGGAPEEVQLLALDEQRALRLLARRPRLARQVLPRLPRSQRRTARSIVAAMGELRRLTPASPSRTLRTGEALPADRLLAEYRAAQRRFGVGWHVLAAVNFVETAFNKLQNNSVAGAQGPMQFIPSTWAQYGMGGNIRDPARRDPRRGELPARVGCAARLPAGAVRLQPLVAVRQQRAGLRPAVRAVAAIVLPPVRVAGLRAHDRRRRAAAHRPGLERGTRRSR
jgi:membrane-bound lytic murein transglycosylase B